MERENSEFSISAASPRSDGGVAGVKTNCFYCCSMLAPLCHHFHFFERKKCHFVVVSSSGDHIACRTQFQPTNFLLVSPVSKNFAFLSWIPNANVTVAATGTYQAVSASNRSNSSDVGAWVSL